MTVGDLQAALRDVPPETEVLVAGQAYLDVLDVRVETFRSVLEKTEPLLPFLEPVTTRNWYPHPAGQPVVVIS